MMKYDDVIKDNDDQEKCRRMTALRMVLNYSYHSDEVRKAMIESINNLSQLKEQSLINAKQALDDALKNVLPRDRSVL